MIKNLLQAVMTLGEGEEGPTTIYEDNQSAIIMAEGTRMHSRTKHIDLRYHAIRGYIKDKQLVLEYKETGEMTADTLTKPLPRKAFEKFRDEMKIFPIGGNEVHEDAKGALGIIVHQAEHRTPGMVTGEAHGTIGSGEDEGAIGEEFGEAIGEEFGEEYGERM